MSEREREKDFMYKNELRKWDPVNRLMITMYRL